MASDLRVGFCERQHNRLSESIAINPFPSKAYPELAPNPLSKLTLPTITTIVTSGLDEKPSFIEDIFPIMRQGNPSSSRGKLGKTHSSV